MTAKWLLMALVTIAAAPACWADMGQGDDVGSGAQGQIQPIFVVGQSGTVGQTSLSGSDVADQITSNAAGQGLGVGGNVSQDALDHLWNRDTIATEVGVLNATRQHLLAPGTLGSAAAVRDSILESVANPQTLGLGLADGLRQRLQGL